MKIVRYVVLCFVILGAGALQLSFTSEVSAQTLSNAQLAEKNLKDFEEWRAAIPDYEKRLFDRVKSVNNRTVRVVRISVAILIVSIISIAISVGILIKTRRAGGLAGSGHVAPGSANVTQIDSRALNKLKKRQNEMRKVLIDLERMMVSVEDAHASASQEKEDLKGVLGKMKTTFDQWDNDLTSSVSEQPSIKSDNT